MIRILKAGLMTAMAVGVGTSIASAADLDPRPPVIEHKPAPISVGGGLYLRGDIGYSLMKAPDLRFDNRINGISNAFLREKTDDALLVGAGIGYQLNKFFRFDVTGELKRNTKIMADAQCGCVPGVIPANFEFQGQMTNANYATFFANAYFEAGTYHGFTPYVGGGVGFTHYNYGTYLSTNNPTTFNTGLAYAQIQPTNPSNLQNQVFKGESGLAFAWNVQAGATYDINDHLKIDGSYRFTRVNGHNVANIANVGFVKTKALTSHDFRLGLRYTFGAKKKDYHQPSPIFK